MLSGDVNCSAVFDRDSGQTLLLSGGVSALATLLALKGGLTPDQISLSLELDKQTLESLVYELTSCGMIDL
ncbi:MAG: putative transcriptional regulator [Motiliproteus sp.]|jgi:predicted transcriptional regulator